jgi:hypothetical protein
MGLPGDGGIHEAFPRNRWKLYKYVMFQCIDVKALLFILRTFSATAEIYKPKINGFVKNPIFMLPGIPHHRG